MKLIKIIKSVIKSVKQLKKPTLYTIFYEFSILFISGLSKQYKFMIPLLKLFKVLKIWTISTAIFSLIYSALGEIFHFTYDYRVIAALILGIGLLIKEFAIEYYFDIHNWILKLLDKIINRLQFKVIETKNQGQIVNQGTIDKARSLTKSNPEYININEVSKNNRVQELTQMSYDNLRKQYKDILYPNTNGNYNMWTDWKFYAVALGIGISLYSVGVYFNYLPMITFSGSWTYLKTSSYNVYESIKDWFTGGNGSSGGNSSSSTSNDKPLIDLKGKSVERKIVINPEEFKGKDSITAKIFEKPSTSSSLGGDVTPSTSGDVTPTQSTVDLSNDKISILTIMNQHLFNALRESCKELVLDLIKTNPITNNSSYPIEWNTITNELEIKHYLQFKDEAIGRFLGMLIELERLRVFIPNYRSILSPSDLDILDNSIADFILKISALVSLHSHTQFNSLDSFIDSILLVAKIENISPIFDIDFVNNIDRIILNQPPLQSSFIPFLPFINKVNGFFKDLILKMYEYLTGIKPIRRGTKTGIFNCVSPVDQNDNLDHVELEYISTKSGLSDKYVMTLLFHHFPPYQIYSNAKIRGNAIPEPQVEEPIFQWVRIFDYHNQSFAYKYSDFDSYKNHILGLLLGYSYHISILHNSGMNIFELPKGEFASLFATRLYLEGELEKLVYFTNLIIEDRNKELLFKVFIIKALEERIDMILYDEMYNP